MKQKVKLREVLRLLLTGDFSHRKLGRLTGLSAKTIKRYETIAREESLEWSAVEKLNDEALHAVFRTKKKRQTGKRLPDWAYIRNRMTEKYQTLIELWEEYWRANPTDAYCYSQFTYYYREYLNSIDITMRLPHRAGEKIFVDFAGTTVPWTDRDTGKAHQAQIFVGVLGCSNYTFVYAVPSQKLPHWIAAHNWMFRFFGGVSEVVVPDNLKSAVTRTKPDLLINRTYLDQSQHYQFVIVPARPYKPQDKAKAEGGVLIASRWILVKLRRRQFFSVDEINEAIPELMDRMNERPLKQFDGCRRSRFEQYDKPALKPLPSQRFEFATWSKEQRVGPDYHMLIDRHAYSVPFKLVGERVEARLTAKTVEIFHLSQRVAAHVRSAEAGGFTTDSTHRPLQHQQYVLQSLPHFEKWAEKIGPGAVEAVRFQFEDKPAYSMASAGACSKLQQLARHYGPHRFEASCQRGRTIQSLTVKSIRSILQCRLDEVPVPEAPIQGQLPLHHNVRGADYYSQGGAHNAH